MHSCFRFVHNRKKLHDEVIKQICRFLIGLKDKGLTFNMNVENLELNNFVVGVDFCGLHRFEDHINPTSSKSRTSYVILLGTSPISWCSKLQTETALSTTKSEIITLSTCMREVL